MADDNVFHPIDFPTAAGKPITVTVDGPAEVEAGSSFTYTVKVHDEDAKNFLNPAGIDPSVAVQFVITSMKAFRFEIGDHPDGGGNLVCVITGLAQDFPGSYTDKFLGLNMQQGFTFDPPVEEMHVIQVKPAS
jgi:hypothetical protein